MAALGLRNFVDNFVSRFFHLTGGDWFWPKIEIVCYFTVGGVSYF